MVDMPSDAERVKMISSMKMAGKIEQVLVSHDIHTRHRLVSIHRLFKMFVCLRDFIAL